MSRRTRRRLRRVANWTIAVVTLAVALPLLAMLLPFVIIFDAIDMMADLMVRR